MSARARLVAALALVAAAACKHGDASLATDYQTMVANAVPKVEQAVGVKFKTPPKAELRSRAEVRDFLVKQFEAKDSKAQLAGQEATYKVLGFIPDTMHLQPYLIDLLTEQVVGYYDPATKILYLNRDAPPEYLGVTITHELVHALQDQYFNLDSLQKNSSADDDRATAAQAVVEGQAMYEQMSMMNRGNIAANFPGGWDRIRDQIREAQSSQPRFSAAPMFIQETLLFPYLSGAEFVRRFKEKDPGQLPTSHMPVSTEQVMHESAFFGPKPDMPTGVTLPPIAGTIYSNDLGEFGTRLFLYQHLKDQNAAVRGAEGWDGDRYDVIRTAAGNGIVWVTVWDTPTDAAEFVSALQDAMAKRYETTAKGSGGGVRTIDGDGRAVRITPGTIGGRDVVTFVDVPSAAAMPTVDLSRVTLTP